MTVTNDPHYNTEHLTDIYEEDKLVYNRWIDLEWDGEYEKANAVHRELENIRKLIAEGHKYVPQF
jgi:hypothetical protein